MLEERLGAGATVDRLGDRFVDLDSLDNDNCRIGEKTSQVVVAQAFRFRWGSPRVLRSGGVCGLSMPSGSRLSSRASKADCSERLFPPPRRVPRVLSHLPFSSDMTNSIKFLRRRPQRRRVGGRRRRSGIEVLEDRRLLFGDLALHVAAGTPAPPPATDVTLGWEFELARDTVLDGLAFYDDAQDGLSEGHVVTLWDAAAPAVPLVRETFAAGSGDPLLSDAWRVRDVATPITLAAGTTYVIAAHYPTAADAVLDQATTITLPDVEYRGARSLAGNGFPSVMTSPPQGTRGFFGPSFTVDRPTTEVFLDGGDLRIVDVTRLPVDAESSIIIDNDEPGYTDTGDLSRFQNQGFRGDVREANRPVEVATYTFQDLPSGAWYKVATTWTAFVNRSPEAPYAIKNVATPVDLTVNQQIEPDDFDADGVGWEDLATVQIDARQSLVAELAGVTFGNVIADAIRLDVSLDGDNDDLLQFAMDVSGPTPELVISQGNGLIGTSIAGATGNHTGTLRVPVNLITGSIIIETGNGQDLVTLDYAGGRFDRPIQYHSGRGTDGLVVRDDDHSEDVTYLPAAAPGSGSLVVRSGGGSETVQFDGSPGLDMTGFNVARVEFPGTDDSLQIAVGTDFNVPGDNRAIRIAGGTRVNGEVVAITTVAVWETTTLEIDTSNHDGADVIEVHGLTTAPVVSNLTVTTGSGADIVDVTDPVTLDGQLAIDAPQVRLADVTAGAMTVGGGSVELGGTTYQATSGGIDFDAAVELGAPTPIAMTTAGGGSGAIRFAASLDGDQVIRFAAGDADLFFDGPVGATQPVQMLQVLSARDVRFAAAVIVSDGMSQTSGSGQTVIRAGNLGGPLAIVTSSVSMLAPLAAAGIDVTAEQQLLVDANLDAMGGALALRANQDGAGSESLVMAPGSRLSTTNTTADAISLRVNTAGGGTGDALFETITATAGRFTAQAHGGRIIDQGASQAVNIRALEGVFAGAAVGTPADPLETDLERLAAEIGAGDGLHVRNVRDLELGNVSGPIAGVVSTSGVVDIAAAGRIAVSSPVNVAGRLVLTASGDDREIAILAPVMVDAAATLTADAMEIGAAVEVQDTLTLVPESAADAGDAVQLGAVTNGTVDTLELSNAELGRLAAGLLRIGDAQTGHVTINQSVSLLSGAVPAVRLQTAGEVTAVDGGVSVAELGIMAGGDVDLTHLDTDVDVLAVATSSNGLRVDDVDGFEVGTVGGVVGLEAAAVMLQAGGSIVVRDTSQADDVHAAGPLEVNITGDDHSFTVATGARVVSTSGGASIIADEMQFDGLLVSLGADVELQPHEPGERIVLGANPGLADTLELDDAELDRLDLADGSGAFGRLFVGRADAGNVLFQGPIGPQQTETLFLTTGQSILDENSTDPDVTVTNLVLSAAEGIGAGAANPTLETQVSNLDVSNQVAGGVQIQNTGDLVLLDLDGTVPAMLAGDGQSGQIRSGGSLTIAVPQQPSGDFTFAAGQSAMTAGDVLTVSADIEHAGSGGPVLRFEAGDDILFSGGTVSSTHDVHIVADTEASGSDAGDRGGIQQTGGQIVAAGLYLEAFEEIRVDQAQNDVVRLAGRGTGSASLIYRDADDLSLGRVNGVIGIQNVPANGNDVSLTVAAQTAGSLTSEQVDAVADLVTATATLTVGAGGGQVGAGPGNPLELNAIELTVERATTVAAVAIRVADTAGGVDEFRLDAGLGTVVLEARGSGNLGSQDEAVDVIASAARFEVMGGHFGAANGQPGKAIEVDVSELQVDTSGGAGDQFILATRDLDELQLAAGGGSILLVGQAIQSGDDAIDVQADSARLTSSSPTAGVGTDDTIEGAALQTEVRELTVDTSAFNQNMFLLELNGLEELQFNAGGGEVAFATDGSGDVLSRDEFDGALVLEDVIASRARLTLVDGTLGESSVSPGAAIETRVDNLTLDTSTATGGDQFLRETDGLAAIELRAGDAEIRLFAGGSIADADADVDVIAGRWLATAAGGVGSSQAIETQVHGVVLENVGGDIRVDNNRQMAGRLEVAGLQQAGGGAVVVTNVGDTATGAGLTVSGAVVAIDAGSTVRLASTGPVLIDAGVTADLRVEISADDTTADGDGLTVSSGVSIASNQALVRLAAGDDLVLAAGSMVQGATSVQIVGDAANADPVPGGHFTLAGAVIAAGGLLAIQGGAGDDRFDLSGDLQGAVAAGIVVDAGAGDDTVTVDSNGPMLAGGTVDNLLSDLELVAGPGNDQLLLEDADDPTSDMIDINGATAGTIQGLTGAEVRYRTDLEQLVVRSGDAAADQFRVAPDADTAISIAGNGPTGTVNGDELIFLETAVKTIEGINTGQLAATGRQPLTFSGIERIDTPIGETLSDRIDLGALAGGSDGNRNRLTLSLDSVGGELLQVRYDDDDLDGDGPVIISSQVVTRVASVEIQGDVDDDLVVVDYRNGYFDVAVHFDGGGQQMALPGDMLAVIGDGASTAATYTPDAVATGSGVVAVDNGTDATVLTFAGLEPLDISGMVSATLSTPNADDLLTVTNGTDFASGGQPAIQVSGSSGGIAFEQAAFWGNEHLTIDLRSVDGDDLVTVASADNGHANDNLTILAGTGSDTISLDGAIAVAGDVRLGSGDRILDGNDDGVTDLTAGGKILLIADGDILGTGTDAQLDLADNSVLVAESASAGQIAVRAAGSIVLESVTTHDGPITVRADGPLTAVLVASQGGGDSADIFLAGSSIEVDTISAAGMGDVQLAATSGGIDDATGDSLVRADRLTFTASAAVGQSNPLVTAVNEIVAGEAAGPGDIRLREVDGLIATRMVAADGSVTLLVDAGDLEIGSLAAVNGALVVTAAAGAINDLQDDLGVDLSAGTTITLRAQDEIGGMPVAGRVVDVTGALEVAGGSDVTADSTQAGDVRLRGLGDLTLTGITTANGSVDVTGLGMLAAIEVTSLLDRDENDIRLSAVGQLRVGALTAGVDGDVVLDGADAVTDDGLIATTVVADVLTVTADGPVTVVTDVTAVDVVTNAAGDVEIHERDAIELTRIVTVEGFVDVEAGGTIAARHVDSAAADTGAHPIRLTSTAGDIFAGLVNGGENNDIRLTAGARIEELGDDAAADLLGHDLLLQATGGIGSLDALELRGVQLDLDNTTTGSVMVAGLGALSLADLNADGRSVDAPHSGGRVSAIGTLMLAADATTGETTAYVSEDDDLDGGDLDDLLVVAPAVTVSTGGGDLDLQAGDRLWLPVGSTIQAAGQLNLRADDGVANPDLAGGVIDVFGGVSSGLGEIHLTTGPDADQIAIDGNGGQVNDGGTVVPLANLLVVDTGAGADALLLDDSGAVGDTSISITADGPAAGTIDGVSNARIQFDGLDAVTLSLGGAGNPASANSVRIAPNLITSYHLDGNAPTFVDANEDLLEADVSGIAGASLSITGPGAGRWTFGDGRQPIDFTSFELIQATGGEFAATLDLAVAGFEDGAADTVVAGLHADGTRLAVEVNGELVFAGADDDIGSFELLGSADDEIFRLVESAGGLPGRSADGLDGFGGQAATGHTNSAYAASGRGPSNTSLHFAGGGGDNSLELAANTPHSVAYFSDTVDASSSGVVNVETVTGDPSLTLSFAGMNGLNVAGGGGTLIVDASANDDVLGMTLSDADGPADGLSMLDGDAASFADVVLSGFANLMILTGNGADTFSLESVDPADPDGGGAADAIAAIVVSGDNTTATDAAADVFDVLSLPESIQLTIRGEHPANGVGGDDTISLGNRSGRVDLDFVGNVSSLDGPIRVEGGAGTGDVLFIDDSGDATPNTGPDAVRFAAGAVSGLHMINGLVGHTGLERLRVLVGDGDDTVNLIETVAGTMHEIDTRGGDDQLVLAGAAGASDTFVVSPAGGPNLANLQMSRAGAVVASLGIASAESVELDGGGGLGADLVVVHGTAADDGFQLAGSAAGAGTVELSALPEIRFERLGMGGAPSSAIRLSGGDGDDTFSITHLAGWQLASITIEGGSQGQEDSVAIQTTGLVDDVVFDSTSATAGEFDVTTGPSTLAYLLEGVEAASIDALDPTFEPGDVLTSTARVTPGSEPGSGSVTQAGVLPVAYRHFETVNAPVGDTLVIEGTDLGDVVTVTLEDLDNDSQVDEEVVRMNGVPIDVSSYLEVILELRDGADVVSIVPHVGDQTLTIPRGLKVRGGNGDDSLEIAGDRTADAFFLTAVGTSLQVDSVHRGQTETLWAQDIEQLDVNKSSLLPADSASFTGGDTFHVADLTQTGLRVINLGLGENDLGEVDTVTIQGRSVADQVTVSGGSQVGLVGLSYDVNIQSAVPGEDQLQILAGDGDDTLLINDLSGSFAVDGVLIQGGAGRDILTGYGRLEGGSDDDLLTGDASSQTLSGGDGNDQLFGAGGDDRLLGGPGEDRFIGGSGDDLIDGGAGVDQIVVMATPGNDTISVHQASDAQLDYELNGELQTDRLLTAGSVERLRVEAGEGADTILVRITDGLFDDPGLSVQTTIVGGAGDGDALSIVDDGPGDLTLHRRTAVATDGTVVIGPLNVEPFEHLFSGIEQLRLIDGQGAPLNTGPGETARAVTFPHDPFEPNDDRFTATPLGVNSITPAKIDAPPTMPLPAAPDEDWYRIDAVVNGTLDLKLQFEEIGMLGTRPGLPGNGNLDIELYDVDGTLIAGDGRFGENDGPDELDVDGDRFAEDERIRVPAVAGQSYLLRVFGRTADAVNGYSIDVGNERAPIPFQLELADPATESASDDPPAVEMLTRDPTPTIRMRLDDASFLLDDSGGAGATPFDQPIAIPFQSAPLTGYRLAVFDDGPVPPSSGTPLSEPVGYALPTATAGIYTFTFSAELAEGAHHLSARVEMIDSATPAQAGFGERSAVLTVRIDTLGPAAFFGEAGIADDGLDPDGSDSGVEGIAESFRDRVTRVSVPTFVGSAEVDAAVGVYVDQDGNGRVGAADVHVGTTIAVAGSGQSNGSGQWQLTSTVDLNDPSLFALDGVRRLLVIAEDAAGNVGAADALTIFLDTQGPRVSGVDVNRRGASVDLFEPDSGDGPTPSVTSLVISLQDLPVRSGVDARFLYPVLAPTISQNAGHFSLIGDQGGTRAISSISFSPDAGADGVTATGTITLGFATALPDDRYTLTVADALLDSAGNALDGESNATEPQAAPQFPSGDGQSGGAFRARFTVDSRPEVATGSDGTVRVDANGNGVFDPDNQDAVNRDFIYQIGTATDRYFAGNFSSAEAAMVASGFDKMAAYGPTESTQPEQVNPQYRFLLDLDHDGAADLVSIPSATFQGPGQPIAGDFSEGHSGDEIGLLTITDRVVGNERTYELRWGLDSNGNNQLDGNDTIVLLDQATYPEIPAIIEARQVIPIIPTLPPSRVDLASLLLPIVGDFNGDGVDDLGLFDSVNNQWNFDLNRDGRRDDVLAFGLPEEMERPLAGDWNLDGIDDLGLFPAAPGTAEPGTIGQPANFRFLVSDQPGHAPSTIFEPYAPTPLGNDLLFEFGVAAEQPVFGNFDPPVAESSGEGSGSGASAYQNPRDRHDVNQDGVVSPGDALRVINAMNLHGAGRLDALIPGGSQYAPPRSFLDVNGDQFVSPGDVLGVINRLNGARSSGAEGEFAGEPLRGLWLIDNGTRPPADDGPPSHTDPRSTVDHRTRSTTDVDRAIVGLVGVRQTGLEDRQAQPVFEYGAADARRRVPEDVPAAPPLEVAIDEIFADWP